MARKRFVTSEISIDKNIARLTEINPMAAALWPWFITNLDDWGRMSADPIEVKLTIFPAFPFTSDDIAEFIKLYDECNIAHYYEVDGKPYLAVDPEKWLKYQTYIRREKLEKQKAKYPEPLNPPWKAKEVFSDKLATENTANDNSNNDLATKIVANHNLATENALSPSPSPSPSIYLNNSTSDTNISNSISNKDIGDAFTKYTGGFLSKYQLEEILTFEDDGMDREAILEAIKRTGEASKPSYQYLKAILNRWMSQGITTLDKVALDEKTHSTTKNKHPSKGEPERKFPGMSYEETMAYAERLWSKGAGSNGGTSGEDDASQPGGREEHTGTDNARLPSIGSAGRISNHHSRDVLPGSPQTNIRGDTDTCESGTADKHYHGDRASPQEKRA